MWRNDHKLTVSLITKPISPGNLPKPPVRPSQWSIRQLKDLNASEKKKEENWKFSQWKLFFFGLHRESKEKKKRKKNLNLLSTNKLMKRKRTWAQNAINNVSLQILFGIRFRSLELSSLPFHMKMISVDSWVSSVKRIRLKKSSIWVDLGGSMAKSLKSQDIFKNSAELFQKNSHEPFPPQPPPKSTSNPTSLSRSILQTSFWSFYGFCARSFSDIVRRRRTTRKHKTFLLDWFAKPREREKKVRE